MMLLRYFLIVMTLFVVYWTAKGVLRRFLAPPPDERRKKVANPRPKPVSRAGSTGIDYTKVKDADYRDIRRRGKS